MPSPLDAELVGNQLLGSAMRLRVATWIAGLTDTKFYADQYANETGHYTSGGVARVCLRLEKLGMVAKLPPTPSTPVSGRCTFYLRLESPLWEVIRALAAAADGRSPVVQPSDRAMKKAKEQLVAMELGLRAGGPRHEIGAELP